MLFEVSDLDTGNIDKNIDTVKYRSRKTRAVPLYSSWTTNTGFFFISEVATWAGIESTDKGKF